MDDGSAVSDRATEWARLYVEDGLSYTEIGKRYGVSRQRVGQLLTPMKLAQGQVKRRRVDRVLEYQMAHARIMNLETTLAEEAERAGFMHPENFRAALARCGLRVRLGRTPEHGTSSRYKSRKYRCRCEKCTRANRNYQAGLKGQEPPSHGTPSGYTNYGCRCPKCTEAHRLYERARRAARRKKPRSFSAR